LTSKTKNKKAKKCGSPRDRVLPAMKNRNNDNSPVCALTARLDASEERFFKEHSSEVIRTYKMFAPKNTLISENLVLNAKWGIHWDEPLRQEPDAGTISAIAKKVRNYFGGISGSDVVCLASEWLERHGVISITMFASLKQDGSVMTVVEHGGRFFKVSTEAFSAADIIQSVAEEIDAEHFYRFSHVFKVMK